MPPAFFAVNPVTSTASSALTYVPAVLLSRSLAFLRTLVVAWILARVHRSTDQGLPAFGAYQAALEFTNLLVPLLMLGAGDVAERYLAHIEHHAGPAALRVLIRRQLSGLVARGILAAALLLLAAPWIAPALWGAPAFPLLLASTCTILLLALYQYLASLLRGLRAYAAAAGLELSSALLLLLFSALAALHGTPAALMAAYALSILLPFLFYAVLLARHLPPPSAEPPPLILPQSTPYAAWTLTRLLLIMLFGFLAIWGVRYLASLRPGLRDTSLLETAYFALPYRIAQLLAFLGVTLWSSVFAIAARSWSHGNRRRGAVQLFRVGRFGAALLLLLAALVLLARPVLIRLLPAPYEHALYTLLPGMLALFTWYALLAFFSTYADLRESPRHGAILWAAAAFLQIAGLLAARFNLLPLQNPAQFMLSLSALALAIPLFLLVPPLFCRPLRFTATAVPLLVASLAPLTLLTPYWVVHYIAPPVLFLALLFLFAANLLLRPADRRALRRRRSQFSPQSRST